VVPSQRPDCRARKAATLVRLRQAEEQKRRELFLDVSMKTRSQRGDSQTPSRATPGEPSTTARAMTHMAPRAAVWPASFA